MVIFHKKTISGAYRLDLFHMECYIIKDYEKFIFRMIGQEEIALKSGAEGECNSSQAKGPGHDEALFITPKEQPVFQGNPSGPFMEA